MAATRRLGRDGLHAAVARHLGWMAAHGTTTAEGKSGYGLDRDTELASLEAIAAAHPIESVPTYLGAHSVPAEFSDGDDYLDFALAEVLPEAARVAEAADVFLERGAFSAEQAERYLRAAAGHGLALRIHGDQFTESGAIPLAVELGARSVDHLEATGADGVERLAASDVAAVLLPVAAMYLRRPMPPARALIDRGAVVALATDFNPGSAFCESLPVVMSLACTQLGMSVAEALAATTVNAAWVLGRADRLGRLAARLRRRHRAGGCARLALRGLPPRRARHRRGVQARPAAAAALARAGVGRGRQRQPVKQRRERDELLGAEALCEERAHRRQVRALGPGEDHAAGGGDLGVRDPRIGRARRLAHEARTSRARRGAG